MSRPVTSTSPSASTRAQPPGVSNVYSSTPGIAAKSTKPLAQYRSAAPCVMVLPGTALTTSCQAAIGTGTRYTLRPERRTRPLLLGNYKRR